MAKMNKAKIDEAEVNEPETEDVEFVDVEVATTATTKQKVQMIKSPAPSVPYAMDSVWAKKHLAHLAKKNNE